MLAIPPSPLQSLEAVCGQWLSFACLNETLSMFQQRVTGREETTAQPQQLPALLHTVPNLEKHLYMLTYHNNVTVIYLLQTNVNIHIASEMAYIYLEPHVSQTI